MTTVTDSADQIDPPPRAPGTLVSPIAVLGTLLLVAGAVLFGVHGPRMGQRGVRIQGIPATNLRDAVLDQVLGDRGGERMPLQIPEIEAGTGTIVESAIDHLGVVFGPAVEPPVLSEEGFELTGSRRLDLLGHSAVRLDYRSVRTRRPAWLFELSDPLDFVHFDDRGRQQPLLPGTRIQETLHLGPGGGGRPVSILHAGDPRHRWNGHGDRRPRSRGRGRDRGSDRTWRGIRPRFGERGRGDYPRESDRVDVTP